MVSYSEQIATLWNRQDAQPYQKGDVRGECLPLVSTIELTKLPWDEAPGLPVSGATGGGIICVKRSTHRCVLTFTITGAMGRDIRLYVKRCKPSRSPLKQLGSLGRASKSQREWELGWGLLERDIPTAVPLLWADRRKAGQLRETYFISLGLEGMVSFKSYHESLAEESERISRLALLGAFIRLAHDKGFAHDDLSTDHVLVSSNGLAPHNTERPMFYFIDLDGSRIFDKKLSGYRRAHNFFQVFRSIPESHFSENQRRAFYNGYSGGKWQDEHIETFEQTIEIIKFQKRLSKIFRPAKWFKKKK